MTGYWVPLIPVLCMANTVLECVILQKPPLAV